MIFLFWLCILALLIGYACELGARIRADETVRPCWLCAGHVSDPYVMRTAAGLREVCPDCFDLAAGVEVGR